MHLTETSASPQQKSRSRRYSLSFGLLFGLSFLVIVDQTTYLWLEPFLSSWLARKYPNIRQLPPQQLRQWMKRSTKPLVLDVREPKEYLVSHLPNSILQPPDAPLPTSLLHQATQQKRPIVAYCSIGYRSSIFLTRLQKDGYKDLWNLQGSIFRWSNQGLPLTTHKQSPRKVHPYNRFWAIFLQPKLRSYK